MEPKFIAASIIEAAAGRVDFGPADFAGWLQVLSCVPTDVGKLPPEMRVIAVLLG